jgi:hypothetical protein
MDERSVRSLILSTLAGAALAVAVALSCRASPPPSPPPPKPLLTTKPLVITVDPKNGTLDVSDEVFVLDHTTEQLGLQVTVVNPDPNFELEVEFSATHVFRDPNNCKNVLVQTFKGPYAHNAGLGLTNPVRGRYVFPASTSMTLKPMQTDQCADSAWKYEAVLRDKKTPGKPLDVVVKDPMIIFK